MLCIYSIEHILVKAYKDGDPAVSFSANGWAAGSNSILFVLWGASPVKFADARGGKIDFHAPDEEMGNGARREYGCGTARHGG